MTYVESGCSSPECKHLLIPPCCVPPDRVQWSVSDIALSVYVCQQFLHYWSSEFLDTYLVTNSILYLEHKGTMKSVLHDWIQLWRTPFMFFIIAMPKFKTWTFKFEVRVPANTLQQYTHIFHTTYTHAYMHKHECSCTLNVPPPTHTHTRVCCMN
jgi:hypothetical protein